jgi:hypothetical protein
MQFYPFFMECCQQEPDEIRRNHLQRLAFGLGGLIFKRDKNFYLCVSEGEFKIPSKFSSQDYQRLQYLLWQDSSEYQNTERVIKTSKLVASLLKKRERFQLIDEFIAKSISLLSKAQQVRCVIALAIVLKIICSQELKYVGGNISAIENAHDEQSLCETFTARYFSLKSIKPAIKYVDKEIKQKLVNKKPAGKSCTVSE